MERIPTTTLSLNASFGLVCLVRSTFNGHQAHLGHIQCETMRNMTHFDQQYWTIRFFFLLFVGSDPWLSLSILFQCEGVC